MPHIKKDLCILKWSKYFWILLIVFIANIAVGIRLADEISGFYNFVIIFGYIIVTVNCYLYYSKYFNDDELMGILQIVPIKMEKVWKLFKVSKLIMVFLPAIVCTILLLISNCKIGWVIIPNSIIMLLVQDYLIKSYKKNNYSLVEGFIVVSMISQVLLLIVYMVELGLILNVF